MKSAWVDRDAQDAVAHYGKAGIAPDLALRIYTTRLLGRDPQLVLHGGGNTSVKTQARRPQRRGRRRALREGLGLGHGHHRAARPAGGAARPAAQGAFAREPCPTRTWCSLQRANLIDPASPNPSVETLLHAFLPHKFVDHTHATAILGIVDQPDSRAICEEVYDGRMGFVRYIMPGFGLAKECGRCVRAKSAGRGADPRQARHLHLRRRARGKPMSA